MFGLEALSIRNFGFFSLKGKQSTNKSIHRYLLGRRKQTVVTTTKKRAKWRELKSII